MEAILLMLTAVLGPIALAVAAPLVELLLAALLLAIEAIGLGVQAARPVIRKLRKPFLIVLATCGVLLVLTQSIVLDLVTRRALWRIKRSSGVDITYRSLSVNLFTGEFTLRGVRLHRSRREGSEFALSIDRVSGDLAVWSSLFGGLELQSLGVSGATGSVRHRTVEGRLKVERQRAFVVRQLSVRDANMTITEERAGYVKTTFDVAITRLDVGPFRSQWAVFDLLFRAQIEGTLDQRPLQVRSRAEGRGRVTSWRAKGVRVQVLAAFVGKPFTWFSKGLVDLAVDDRWKVSETAAIDSHHRYVLRDFALVKQPQKGVRRRIFNWVARRFEKRKQVTLAFRVKLDPQLFKGATTLQRIRLSGKLARDLLQQILRNAGKKEEIP